MYQKIISYLISCTLFLSSLSFSQPCSPCVDCPACVCTCTVGCETENIIKSGAIAIAPFLILLTGFIGTLGMSVHHYGGYKAKRARLLSLQALNLSPATILQHPIAPGQPMVGMGGVPIPMPMQGVGGGMIYDHNTLFPAAAGPYTARTGL